MPRRWHVATTRPQQQVLADRELRRQGFETFNPRCRVRWPSGDGRDRYKIEPYLPGYVFIRFDAVRDDWGCIRGTRGVGRLLAQGELPCRIRKGIIEGMVRLFRDSFAVDERRLDELIIQSGDDVTVLGMPAVRATVTDRAHARVGMMVEMFGRQVRASAKSNTLRKIEEAA